MPPSLRWEARVSLSGFYSIFLISMMSNNSAMIVWRTIKPTETTS